MQSTYPDYHEDTVLMICQGAYPFCALRSLRPSAGDERMAVRCIAFVSHANLSWAFSSFLTGRQWLEDADRG